ncbi:MAG: hypothetical protein HWE30_12080 [Methylocystaceae bacterium]|nr:hypothetical protein [Methylocystaceae bacterium]
MNEQLKTKAFWRRAAAIFTLVWIGFVVVFTQGEEDHWLNHTMFLLPIAFWAVVLFVFRKEERP